MKSKFDRKKLDKLTLQKIQQVNDEAGYRQYLEVPEMVEIVASIIEDEMFEDVAIENKKEEWKCLLDAVTRSYQNQIKQWQECADRLYTYAEEIQCTVRNKALYQVVCEDIELYKKLKNEAK